MMGEAPARKSVGLPQIIPSHRRQTIEQTIDKEDTTVARNTPPIANVVTPGELARLGFDRQTGRTCDHVAEILPFARPAAASHPPRLLSQDMLVTALDRLAGVLL